MDLTALAESVFPQTAALAANVTPDQYANRTPCAEWDVHQLLNHIVSTHHMFASLLAGEDPSEPLDLVGDDPGTAYQHAVKASLEAFRAPGALDTTLPLPNGPTPGAMALGMLVMDNLVHGWDLAQGTGQQFGIDEELAEGFLAQVRQLDLPRVPAEGAYFGAEVAVPESAPAADRLLGFLGRRP